MVQSNISLTTDILKVKSTELEREINHQVLKDILIAGGWTSVKFLYSSGTHAIDVMEWLEKNVHRSNWKRISNCYLFKNKKDAEWFILRWV